MCCPSCGGLLRREPATCTCIFCGRFLTVTDAPDVAQRQQLAIDYERRPRSVECLSPFNEAAYLGPRRLHAAVQPGPRLPVMRREST